MPGVFCSCVVAGTRWFDDEEVTEDREGFLRRARRLQVAQIVGRDHAPLGHRRDVHDLVPVVRAIEHDRELLRQLLGLRQRQDLVHLVERPEAAREHHQRLGQVGEPQLPHEEVVELEAQALGRVLVQALLERQLDVEADALAAGLEGAAVGRFHDAGTAARADHEAVVLEAERQAPLGQQMGQAPGVLVVARHRHGAPGPRQRQALRLGRPGGGRRPGRAPAAGAALEQLLLEPAEGVVGLLAAADPGRAEEHDRVLDVLRLEAAQRLQVLGHDADRPGFIALEKGGVEKRQLLVRHGGENVSSSDEPIPGWISGTRARAVRRDRDGTGQRGADRQARVDDPARGGAGSQPHRGLARGAREGQEALRGQLREVPRQVRQGRRPGRRSGRHAGGLVRSRAAPHATRMA